MLALLDGVFGGGCGCCGDGCGVEGEGDNIVPVLRGGVTFARRCEAEGLCRRQPCHLIPSGKEELNQHAAQQSHKRATPPKP